MNDTSQTASIGPAPEDSLTTDATSGPIEGDASLADAEAFQRLLEESPDQWSDEQLQEQYDKNFQTISYLIMKGIYTHVEDAMRRRR